MIEPGSIHCKVDPLKKSLPSIEPAFKNKKATLCFPLNFSLLQLATKETPMRFFYWCGV
jgi:hypothetical protein